MAEAESLGIFNTEETGCILEPEADLSQEQLVMDLQSPMELLWVGLHTILYTLYSHQLQSIDGIWSI